MSHGKITARVRGADPGTYPENRDEEQLHINNLGDLILSRAVLPLVETVRQGETWQVLFGAGTALTGVPSTSGLGTVWNGEPGNGKYFVIDSVQCFRPIIDVTTVDMATLWAQISRPPVATPTDAALAIRSLSGRYSYGGRARTISSLGTTLSNRWEVIGQMGSVAAIAGSAWVSADIDVLGKFIVPPGGAFSLHASEVTATASGIRFAVRWHEVLTPLVS